MRTYTGVHTALGDHLAVEAGELVNKGEILEKDGSSLGSNSQAVFVVSNRSSIRSGKSRIHLREQQTGSQALFGVVGCAELFMESGWSPFAAASSALNGDLLGTIQKKSI